VRGFVTGKAFSCRLGINLIGALAAVTGASVISASETRAYSDGAAWNPFASPAPTYTQPYDRSFIREWEAHPPRGYPTISKANIEPMKAAIKRYTEIVERGGWKPVPRMKLQAGMTSPAVAILRERLYLSGDLKERSGYPEYFRRRMALRQPGSSMNARLPRSTSRPRFVLLNCVQTLTGSPPSRVRLARDTCW